MAFGSEPLSRDNWPALEMKCLLSQLKLTAFDQILGILSLYFRFLEFSDSTATVLYHTFCALSYLVPVLGAILADSFLGMWKTILYLTIVYVVGTTVLTIGAVGDTSNGSLGIPGMPTV